MKTSGILSAIVVAFSLAACGGDSGIGQTQPSKFRSYDGPPVTQVQVSKSDRKLYLLNGTAVLRSYDIGLGFQPVGHKQFEGDGKTPEGSYIVDRRNPNSAYHLSVGISYPNANDRINALANAKLPGGDIFVHGASRTPVSKQDWTAGCIAVTDDEIEEIYAMVRDGTPITITP